MISGLMPNMKISWIVFALSIQFSTGVQSEELVPPDKLDFHKTELGIWDIHVCNWPDRPPFYLSTFITEKFDEIDNIEVFDPAGKNVGSLDLEKFLTVKREEKPDLRIYVTQLPMAEGEPSGIFSAQITTANNKRLLANDYLVMAVMDRISVVSPVNGAEVSIPWELSWTPPKGAQYHRVWIKDMWNDGKQIFDSGYFQGSAVEIAEGLLEPGGLYQWRIHSRDTQDHILLGRFNHGSLTDWMEFSISED